MDRFPGAGAELDAGLAEENGEVCGSRDKTSRFRRLSLIGLESQWQVFQEATGLGVR
jgi:hypothetical protein